MEEKGTRLTNSTLLECDGVVCGAGGLEWWRGRRWRGGAVGDGSPGFLSAFLFRVSGERGPVGRHALVVVSPPMSPHCP